MEKFFLLNFEKESPDFHKGLSVNDTYEYDDLPNHYFNPLKIPPRNPKYSLTIVWDLDQTLVSGEGMVGEDSESPATKLVIRPYADKVLTILRSLPEIEFIVWTAGNESHAKRVVNSLPKGMFDYVISRGEWAKKRILKDLNKLGRDLNTMILIDDRMDVGEPHPENLLVIPIYDPKVCGPDDTTMLYLANIVYRAYKLFIMNRGKIPFRTFLYSPLTQKCIYSNTGEYYYGIKCFKSYDELENRINMFQN